MEERASDGPDSSGLRAAGLDPEAALDMFLGLLGRTHLTAPGELAAAVAEQARVAGGENAVIYLADYEQRHLIRVPRGRIPAVSTLGWDGAHPLQRQRDVAGDDGVPPLVDDRADEGVLTLEGSLAGRSFATDVIVQSTADRPELRRLWMPLLDGTDRLGVLVLDVPCDGDVVPDPVLAVWERFSHLVAQLVIGKGAYTDVFEQVRRSRPMALSAELQWSMLPPLTFATAGLVVAAMLEPCYDDGGDTFDYAVNADTLHVALIDSMGHGTAASVTSATALAAYRRARRMGLDLPDTYALIDAELRDLYDGERYATALFAQVHLPTGRLRWISAGHPAPVLLRDGRMVKSLEATPATPVGIPFNVADLEIGSEDLEPGDRILLYTDGLPEARLADGSFFGIERLVDFLERAAQDGYAAPETLRRLRRSVLQHQQGVLQDDATAVLVEWRAGTESALLPDTVEI